MTQVLYVLGGVAVVLAVLLGVSILAGRVLKGASVGYPLAAAWPPPDPATRMDDAWLPPDPADRTPGADVYMDYPWSGPLLPGAGDVWFVPAPVRPPLPPPLPARHRTLPPPLYPVPA